MSTPPQRRPAGLLKRGLIILVILCGVFVGLNRFSGRHRVESSESAQCANNMIALGFAARMWSNDNGDHLPLSFVAMSNEIVTPKILRCPSDRARQPLTRWADVTADHVSYEMVSPGAPESDTQTVYLRCHIHGHQGYVDGTVVDNQGRRRSKQ